MNFHAAIHPFQMTSAYPDSKSFFTSLENRKSLLHAIREQIKWELGNIYVSEERGNQCQAYFNIAKNNFLGELQEYAANLDHVNLETIYMGMDQSRFNHLIEIRNNIGIYLPIFFFFPLRISIKQNVLPIFLGSSIKLQIELIELEKTLKSREKVNLGEIKDNFQANEEQMEDYEASYEGTENFWACFEHIILSALVKKSLECKLPIFIF